MTAAVGLELAVSEGGGVNVADGSAVGVELGLAVEARMGRMAVGVRVAGGISLGSAAVVGPALWAAAGAQPASIQADNNSASQRFARLGCRVFIGQG